VQTHGMIMSTMLNVKYSALQCSIAQLGIAHRSTVLCSAVQYCTVQYSAVQYCTVLCSAVQCNASTGQPILW
jgi:hypothetical protein